LPKRFLQIVVSALAAVVGFVLLVPAVILLGLVVFLEKVPAVGRLVGAFVSLFAEFIGDPQVWKNRPLQAAAMRQRIRHALAPWQDKDIPVTVVAHSQGAAVAGQVLFQKSIGKRPGVTNFVTVGSGLGLLGYADWGGHGVDPVSDWLNTDSKIHWINVWGKFDFVPAGPIGTADEGSWPVFTKVYDPHCPTNPGPGPEEHPVYNRSAIILDHVVYSKNRVEVIDPIARLILPRRRLTPPVTPSLIRFGTDSGKDKRLRPHRVMVKGLGVTLALSIAAGLVLAPALTSFADSISRSKHLGWLRDLGRCSGAGDEPGPWWSLWLCSGSSFRWDSVDDWLVLVGVAALIAAVFIALLNGPVWGYFHELVVRRRRKLRRSPHRKPGDLPRGRAYRDGRDPWRGVVYYVCSTVLLTVLWPLSVLTHPGVSQFEVVLVSIYLAFAAWLTWESFRGTAIQPLQERRITPTE
jgi:hypothetical protein